MEVLAATSAATFPTINASNFPKLAGAVFMKESGMRPGVRGPMTKYGQALGLSQMLPGTAQEMAVKNGLPWRPDLMTGKTPEAAEYQARLGAAYLHEGLRKTGNVRDALRYYHGGPDRRLWGPKTDAYADSILSSFGG